MSDDKKKVININQDSADKLRKAENHKTLFEETKNGSLKTTSVKNVVLILKTDKNLQSLFKFNEFTNEVDVVRDANLDTSIGKISISEGQYTDQVINSVELYIESSKTYGGAFSKLTSNPINR